MITCRSAAELERLARVNALVARVLAELMAGGGARDDDQGPGRAGRAAAARSRGPAGVQGLSRVSGDDLRLGQRAGDSRDPERPSAGRGRHPVDRHGRQDGRVFRRLGGDGADRADLAGSRAAADGDARSRSIARSAWSAPGRGCTTSARRCSSTSRRTDSRWCGSSSATASARRSTRSRRFRTTAPRAAARGWRRAWSSRSSRW